MGKSLKKKKLWGGGYKAMYPPAVSHRELSIARDTTIAFVFERRNQTMELLSSHSQPGT